MSRFPHRTLALAALLLAGTLATPAPARAHCDTLDGPVVVDARTALASGEIGPALKWVRSADEGAIRSAFARALEVRKAGGPGSAAADLADTWFFETLVRIHRAGEGAPFTGLKPAGEVEPGIAAADRALATGKGEELAAEIAAAAREALSHRFQKVVAARAGADKSVEAGREYVAAYVEFIHFVEALHQAVERGPAHAHAE